MLHSSSLHYYACYYALLCLLRYQQQAATVTIIIDGATTNEWATRDEYQRLIDSSQGPAAQNTGDSSLASTNSALATAISSPSLSSLSSLSLSPAEAAAAAAVEAAAEAEARLQAPLINGDNQKETNVRQTTAVDLDDLQLALDRLDLIEHERKEQVQQLNRLQVLEKMAESNVVLALSKGKSNANANANTNTNANSDLDFGSGSSGDRSNHESGSIASLSRYLNQQQEPIINVGSLQSLQSLQLQQQQQQQEQPLDGDGGGGASQSVIIGGGGSGGGARTLGDLVPFTDADADVQDQLRRLRARETPKRYCGDKLIELLEMVCNNSFTEVVQPKIVHPTIKFKRSIDFADGTGGGVVSSAQGEGGGGSGGGAGPTVSRRRKLRTLTGGLSLGDNGGGSGTFINNDGNKNLLSNYDNGNNLDDSHNQHRQRQQQQQQQQLQQQQQQQQQDYLSSIDNHNQKLNHNQNHNQNHNINNKNNNNNHNNNNDSPSVRNRHSRIARYRRIRGVSSECCDKPCYVYELKPYCNLKN